MMEGNSRTHLYNQDSLAAEMLNKLSGAGFSTVAIPEGISLQQPHAGSSLLSAPDSALNSSLLSQPVSQTSVSGDNVILGSGGSLDPALTQLLVAAQTGNSASNAVSNIPAVLAHNVAVSVPSSNAHILHPVLTGALPQIPSHNVNPEGVVPADPTPALPASAPSHEAMTITVHCTMSDTVVVVGQQNWQCCMCREICGFDTSIDQHLSLKHNLHIKTAAVEENRFESKGHTAASGLALSDDKMQVKNKMNSASAEPLQTISESALASLKAPDSGNSRTGLEREVALLMAQTFTHSPNIIAVDEGMKNGEDSAVRQVCPKSENNSVPLSGGADTGNESQVVSNTSVDATGSWNVYGYMISKVEQAIVSTADYVAKNDLLLVATELRRMQKEMTSKRRQMKKTHRYIPCPECGKEVRNRKDLIKQHNRCHEKTKKYRCLICNKLFKYMHTLRRHVVRQNHQGGLPEKADSSQCQDVDTNDMSVSEELSIDHEVKAGVDETDNESETIINVDFTSLTSETAVVSSESKEDGPQTSGEPAYEKILAALLSKGEQSRTSTGRKQSLLQCFVCDREIRNRNYYITRHARCHIEDLCYTCSVCGQEFYRSDYYRQHMIEHGTVSFEENVKTSELKSKPKLSQADSKRSGRPSGGPKKNWTPKPTTVPCKICGKGIFNRTYNIKRHAQQHSIVEWESILSPPQHSSSSRPQNKSSASAQHFLHCGVCGLNFQTYSRKRLHMLKHRSSFQCRLCHVRFDSGAELLIHCQDCRKTGNGASELASENRSLGSDQPDVHHGVRGPSWKKQALGQASSPRKWTCPICQARIIHTLPSISRHMRELHSEGQPHNCPKCNRTYTSYHKMQRHLKTHGDLGGMCDVCGKIFQTKAALRSHTKLHASPEGMFQCPKCPTSFRFKTRLEKHMQKHAERTEVCPHCGKVYISKIHLQRHISVDHLGVKDYRYKCDQCGAQFFENIQLRDHIAYRHEGVQVYTCKYCDKGFNCRPTMVRHERKEHTNYLPYKCKHCSQGFPEKSKLVAHEMTHTGMSPHKCDVCGKYFTTGGALRAHKNLHLGVKPFECGACGKTYLKNWHLQQHIRKSHHTIEVMVYNLPAQNQRQDVVQPPVSQQNILPVVDQSCLQTADAKFLHAPVQGEYLQVQTVDGNKLQQQPGAGGSAQPASNTLVQTQVTVEQHPKSEI